jgi:hypothetical protein
MQQGDMRLIGWRTGEVRIPKLAKLVAPTAPGRDNQRATEQVPGAGLDRTARALDVVHRQLSIHEQPLRDNCRLLQKPLAPRPVCRDTFPWCLGDNVP